MDEPRVSLGVRRHEPLGWQCWVCLGTDEEDPLDWVDPCNCIGTTKWVHLPCLMRWIDEKQQGNTQQGVSCPHCNTPYLIKEPRKGLIVILLDKLNKQGHKLSNIMAGCVLVGSVYWVAATYGAFTVLQVMGHDEGFALLYKTDPLFLVLVLPVVPVTVISSRFINWDETVMYFLRRCATKFSLLGKMFPLFASSLCHGQVLETLGLNDTISWLRIAPLHLIVGVLYSVEKPAYRIQYPDWEKLQHQYLRTRLVCGGLIFPSVATFFGRVFFKSYSAIQRAVYGGLTYILVKGLISIYYKQNTYYRMCKRTVLRPSGGLPVNLEPISSPASVDDSLTPSRTDVQQSS